MVAPRSRSPHASNGSKPAPDATPVRRRTPRARAAFSPRDVLYVLFRHRGKAVVTFLGIFLLTTAAALLLPSEFQSEAKLKVQLGRESVAIDPTATIGAASLPMQ
ncbi:MAG: hypothetical protein AAF561_12880, partial [Planctomycetota bacterium]